MSIFESELATPITAVDKILTAELSSLVIFIAGTSDK